MPATVTSDQLVIKEPGSWTNKHLTYTQRLERLIDIWNPLGASAGVRGYNATTRVLQDLIGESQSRGKRLRALGSGWSFTKVVATEHDLLNTKPLNWVFKMSARNLSAQYKHRDTPERLTLAQCGVAVLELNNYLRTKGRALETSGASNGQTIAGALSTGTHGSAIDFGGIPEFVVGLHVITGPNKHVWIERASYPVVNDAFISALGATPIRNDQTFNAALVSLGNFGIIHSVMIETADLFLLEASRIRLPYDDKLKHTISTLDFSDLPGQPYPGLRPYHFEIVLNPYNMEDGAYVTFMYKRPYRDDYPRPSESLGGFGPGDDAPTFIGLLADSAPSLIPKAVNELIKLRYNVFPTTWGTLGEIFTNTTTRGKAAGSALGVPLDQVLKAVDTALEVHRRHGPYGAIIALRYVKGSDALMSFTGHKPTTCIVDLDGVNSARTLDHYHKAWQAFEDAGIPFRMHWGKFNDFLNPQRVRRMYGGATVDTWLAERSGLLDAAARRVFTNKFAEQCGLVN